MNAWGNYLIFQVTILHACEFDEMGAKYAVGRSLSLSLGIQPPPDADGI